MSGKHCLCQSADNRTWKVAEHGHQRGWALYEAQAGIRCQIIHVYPSLYAAEKKESEKSATIKTNRSILQPIITTYDAGRRVDLPWILSRELMVVPPAIADANG